MKQLPEDIGGPSGFPPIFMSCNYFNKYKLAKIQLLDGRVSLSYQRKITKDENETIRIKECEVSVYKHISPPHVYKGPRRGPIKKQIDVTLMHPKFSNSVTVYTQ